MTEIDRLIEEWRAGDSGQELHTFLAMTKREYAHWVKTDELPYGWHGRLPERKSA